MQDVREGTRRVYSVNPYGEEPLRAYLDRIWGVALERFTEVANDPSRREKEAKQAKARH